VKLLAIETATEACSAALFIDGDIIHRYEIAPREHARRILVMVDQLMAEAQLNPTQLDAVAFGRGPGSFIGVRIAAGVTQGIAYSSDLPVAPVSTLAAIAQGSGFARTLVAIDARMGEIYWGQFERPDGQNTVVATDEERLIKPDQLAVSQLSRTQQWFGVGTGWQAYHDQLVSQLPQVKPSADHLYPSAVSIAELAIPAVKTGRTVRAEQAVPVYLRDKVAEKSAQ